MKYNLVAIFDDKQVRNITFLHKNIFKRYRTNYNMMPPVFIPVQVIDDPDIENFDLLMKKLLHPFKVFKVQLTGAIYYDNLEKMLKIDIENKGYINRLVRNISDDLKLSGFKVKDLGGTPDIHIPVHFTGNFRTLIKKEEEDINNRSSFSIVRFELWQMSGVKKRTIIKSYDLRTY